MYYNLSYTKYLKRNQTVLVKTKDWNDDCPFVVCQWIYGKFIFNEQENELFSNSVVEFMPLDGNGCPINIDIK